MSRFPTVSALALLCGVHLVAVGAEPVLVPPATWAPATATGGAPPPVAAVRAPSPLAAAKPAATDVLGWLQRMHAASHERNYVGTFVISAPAGNLSSARVWHACDGDVQVERIEALSGPPRSSVRRNDHVLTFLPEARVVRSERRENLERFPGLRGAPDSRIADFYGMRLRSPDRVAGVEADVVEIVPKDRLRFGYRIWSERRSGLVLKAQTLDSAQRPIEQAAFTDLQLDAPLDTATLAQMMSAPPGYRLEEVTQEHTTALAHGWRQNAAVPGFVPISCYQRAIGAGSAASERTLQWTFSDGLASVSLFIEPYADHRGGVAGIQTMGATSMLTRQLTDKGSWWLTAVGEVPPQTLDVFARSLEWSR
ncbi:MAG: MucB/RseB C-terminal domain-containing protein [Variovorax sp.]